jgi:hypothetical protein
LPHSHIRAFQLYRRFKPLARRSGLRQPPGIVRRALQTATLI